MYKQVKIIAQQNFEMQDTGKAEDLSGQLKAAKEDAIRQLKDKQELFDGETIKLGKYNFSVNKQQLDLTIVNKNDELYFHLLGTNFYEKISDANLEENIKFWNQDVVSENDKVYRAEYLAWLVFQKVIIQKNNMRSLPTMSSPFEVCMMLMQLSLPKHYIIHICRQVFCRSHQASVLLHYFGGSH